MNSTQRLRALSLTAFFAAVGCLTAVATQTAIAAEFSSRWDQSHDRTWIGAAYWANPMEDWQIVDGKAHCTSKAQGRSLHLLTRKLSDRMQPFGMSVDFEKVEGAKGAVGFDLGVHDDINDYRGNCVWGQGVPAVMHTDGTVRIGPKSGKIEGFDGKSGTISLQAVPAGQQFKLTLTVSTLDGKELGSVSANVATDKLIGNVALSHNSTAFFPASQRGRRQPNRPTSNAHFEYSNWQVAGEKLDELEDQKYGPILWSMYSVSDSRGPEGYVMKITAVLPPVGTDDSQVIELDLMKDGQKWTTAGQAKLHEEAFVATFRIPNWDADQNIDYRLSYDLKHKDGTSEKDFWKGTIRAQPKDRPLVLGGLTCQEHRGFPYGPVAENLTAADPDMLFFSGDQIYESSGGFGIIRRPADRAITNFLRKQYMFGWAFGKVMADRPTLCIPDDHDVFQGNIWGEGGKAMPDGGNTSTDGGYIEPIRMVEVVHQINTSHHPDFYDTTPIKQNMSVYYGDMVWGRVSFAIIGDRQFKSAPGRVDTGGGRADHVSSADVDLTLLDKPGLVLLGDRQEAFLEHWVGDWRGADMKVLLSETVFANAATHHGSKDGFLYADLDSGGWPQTARNRAIRIVRRAMPIHVNGDQHLTTMVQYGTDAPRDAFYSFCTPAISVGYQRWWRPDEMGKKHTDRPKHGMPNTGSYLDGFGNHVYVYSVGNPEGSRDPNRYQQAHIKASGFGIIRIDSDKRQYTCEAYRFLKEDPSAKLPNQFQGWPVVIDQRSNDGRKPVAWLPELKVSGLSDPVVRVIDESTGELVYALRIKGQSFKPHVYADGKYTVEIGEQPGKMQKLTGLSGNKQASAEPLKVQF